MYLIQYILYWFGLEQQSLAVPFLELRDIYGEAVRVIGVVQIAIGIVLVLVLERTNKERISSLLIALLIVVLGIIGYQILHILT